MNTPKFPCFLCFFCFTISAILINLSLTSSQTNDFVYDFCGTSGNFTINSTYSRNLNTLLSTLSSNVTQTDGFKNASIGQNPDRIFGLFLCRGDVSLQFCQTCAAAARNAALQRCPNQKESILYYEKCMIRYSNQSILGGLQTSPALFLTNPQNVSDRLDVFNRNLADLFVGLGREASRVPNGPKFSTGSANFSAFQTIYGLMQCTTDLSQSDCFRCLEGARANLPSCCNGKIGARVILPSCNLRYEVSPFYESRVPAIPPSPPPTPPRTISPVLPNGTSTPGGSNGNKKSRIVLAIVIPISIALVAMVTAAVCLLMRKKKRAVDSLDVDDITTSESLHFEFSSVRAATDNFSEANKLGEGGFGPVYKGILSNGQEIAVKRLSRNSSQGIEQFKNEVVVMAKLQHRNLVRLLGFSFEGEEKILIYEYVPNLSLDHFIFDPDRRAEMNWEKRYKIIGGIARGLLYLHEESRHRIIHRDLKAGNVLLDADMNPKISDFGMARLVVMDETHVNTNRVVGTYGYMAPEYAMHGQFSVKSDVYSFGVLILEIVTGQKVLTFEQSEHGEDLLSYAWRNWKQGTALELIDPALQGTCSANEVVRCIHIGLLCVQEDYADRPNMASVVLMLTSYSVSITLPSKPAFLISSKMDPIFSTVPEESVSSEPVQAMGAASPTPWSINDVTMTEIEPR
ncbi:hypothetical protein Sjap_025316 [Stephania japonica]|uniref:Cysteine-rich receptor-like protein kinase 10 n=1 Tax=Stephania japonica TaxID=461633 RepID=A0AAP0E437_9MAGN